MITARNKLQEENQELRDKLQDAEMFIRLLELKLAEFTKTSGSKPKPRESRRKAALKARVDSALRWKPEKSMTKSRLAAATRSKDAFRNVVAPGVRTFTSPTSDVDSNNDANVKSKDKRSLLNGRRDFLERANARDSCHVVSLEAEEKMSSGKSDHGCDVNGIQIQEMEQKDDSVKEMTSVIGKLAQIVIDEYGTTDNAVYIS